MKLTMGFMISCLAIRSYRLKPVAVFRVTDSNARAGMVKKHIVRYLSDNGHSVFRKIQDAVFDI